MTVKTISINLPEYTIDVEPDYLKLGKTVDNKIIDSYPNGKYLIRAISSEDHPNLSLDKLASSILRTGTDKYDPKRKPVAYHEFKAYDYDIQASRFEVNNSKITIKDSEEVDSMFGQIIYDFYNHAPYDRGYPVRINLLLIYDASKMVPAQKINPKIKRVNKKLEKYLYKFADRNNKKDALVGIVKMY